MKKILRKAFFAGVVIGGSVVAYRKEILGVAKAVYTEVSSRVEDSKVVKSAVDFVKKAPGVATKGKFESPADMQEFLDRIIKVKNESKEELDSLLEKVKDVSTELESRVESIINESSETKVSGENTKDTEDSEVSETSKE